MTWFRFPLILIMIFLLVSCSKNVTLKKSPEAGASPSSKGAINRATLDGYRSARFGMTEAEVRQAISRDFAVQDTAIQRQVQPTQQTAILSLRVPQLAPHSGPGQVFYVFGHRSQRLMQVNILWGKPATPTPDAAGLVKTAHQLRDGFLAMAFRKEGRVVDREVARGVFWLFHGLDDQGRGVDLFLINPRQPGNPPDNPITLRLSYIQNPAAPDVFKAP